MTVGGEGASREWLEWAQRLVNDLEAAQADADAALAALAALGGSAITGSDFVTSSTSFVDAGLSFMAEASATYIVELDGAFRSSALTNGTAFALKIPSGSVTGFCIPTAADYAATFIIQRVDDSIVGATGNVPTANADLPLFGRWVVQTGVTGGAVNLRMLSENGGQNVTLRSGSILKWSKQ